MGSQAGITGAAYDRIKAEAGSDTADAIQQLMQLLSKTRVDVDQLLGVRVGAGLDIRLAHCVVWNSAVQSIATGGSGTALTFDTEDIDPAGMHAPASSTSRITFSRAGYWRVHARTTFAANVTGVRGLNITKNGSTPLGSANVVVNIAGNDTTFECHIPSTLFAAGDYVEVIAFQNSGGNLNVGSTGRNTASEFAAEPVLR